MSARLDFFLSENIFKYSTKQLRNRNLIITDKVHAQWQRNVLTKHDTVLLTQGFRENDRHIARYYKNYRLKINKYYKKLENQVFKSQKIFKKILIVCCLFLFFFKNICEKRRAFKIF